jgi:hypothetical protein
MPEFIVERAVPRGGSDDLPALAEACRPDDSSLQWLETVVTDDRLYCLYASDGDCHPGAVDPAGHGASLPVIGVRRVRAVIDPSTSRRDDGEEMPSSTRSTG